MGRRFPHIKTYSRTDDGFMLQSNLKTMQGILAKRAARISWTNNRHGDKETGGLQLPNKSAAKTPLFGAPSPGCYHELFLSSIRSHNLMRLGEPVRAIKVLRRSCACMEIAAAPLPNTSTRIQRDRSLVVEQLENTFLRSSVTKPSNSCILFLPGASAGQHKSQLATMHTVTPNALFLTPRGN